jgi:hypothetical protein
VEVGAHGHARVQCSTDSWGTQPSRTPRSSVKLVEFIDCSNIYGIAGHWRRERESERERERKTHRQADRHTVREAQVSSNTIQVLCHFVTLQEYTGKH